MKTTEEFAISIGRWLLELQEFVEHCAFIIRGTSRLVERRLT
jgi:hypothetical protein